MGNFGDEIKIRRVELDLTQADLARLSGVPQPRIAEYEIGRRQPTLENLHMLAEVLGPFEIVGGVRTAEHYREQFATASTIGVQLVARAVYARRHGHADDPDVGELREIVRELQAQHGEAVTAEQALELLAQHLEHDPADEHGD